jgi:hypothetical protein
VTLVFNYVFVTKGRPVSNNHTLYVIPPDSFFIIWAVIYTALLIVNVYNLIENQWSKTAHLFFALSNVFNSLWAINNNIDYDESDFVNSFLVFAGVPLLLKTWFALGDRP